MARISRRALLKGGLGGLLLAPAAYVTGVSMGGYGAREGLILLSEKEARILESVAEVFFPDQNDLGVTIKDVELIKNVDELLSTMPKGVCSRVKMMLWGTEHVLPAVNFRFKKFSRLDLASREKLLARLERSGSISLRAVFRVLKGLVQSVYFNHPLASAQIGFIEKCRA